MSRNLVVSSDDFGLCASLNEASIEAMRKGIVRSVSIMAPTPAFDHGVRLALKNGIRRVGVHLTLNSEFATWRWAPLSPLNQSRSLRGPDGTFHSAIEETARTAALSEIQAELERQVRRVVKAGLQPTHLDSHMFALHPHTTKRKDLIEVIARLCRKFRLPFRSPFPEESRWLAKRNVRTLNNCRTDTYDIPTSKKRSAYRQLLREVRPGVSEFILHCGYDNRELRGITAHSRRRQMDFDFAMSRGTLRLINETGIRLISWEEAARLI